MASGSAPALLDPISALDVGEADSAHPGHAYYLMLMQSLAVAGQIVAGFDLLARAEACGLLTHSDENCFDMFRTLLVSCRTAGDHNGASRVQSALQRLRLIPRVPAARVLVHGSENQFENGISGTDPADAQKLWSELSLRTVFTPQLQVLPWAFVQSTSKKQQEASLQLHAEKKALTVLLACAADELIVSIGFNACTDCHDALKNAALLLGRRIYLRQPKMVHAFADGSCSCNDRWRWEARISLSQA
eukprot:gnl/TRDRNA2_/TRDRNA2_174592_c9_seq23.p1 gnl/TRDRNA2_/TRDRNA2_174592_c9~~gnl/TRDRNA2_/TRDRNA2_174592_c9_seq23.p1  ORF type:complete len:247 (+),score=42.74 gnl/TRDRNA2_/TRDRNA2_174592_c9_seq23:695-1435(+)